MDCVTLTRQQAYHRLRTIPGIGPTSAVRLLAELACLSADMKLPEWVAYAGLGPATPAVELVGRYRPTHFQSRQ